jgi:hypothetical protein
VERSSISLISLHHTALVLSCRFVFLLPTALTQRPAVVDTILHYQRACSLICKSDISTLLTLTSFHLNQLCWFSKAGPRISRTFRSRHPLSTTQLRLPYFFLLAANHIARTFRKEPTRASFRCLTPSVDGPRFHFCRGQQITSLHHLSRL